jgi:hypothetical protein
MVGGLDGRGVEVGAGVGMIEGTVVGIEGCGVGTWLGL